MDIMTLNNGVQMPVLGFGTYQVTDADECENCVAEAIKTGYRLLDTAQAYGNEEAVGAGIRKSGVSRGELFITTKVWFRNYETEACRRSLEESLVKLGTDYLDMVLLHWPFGNVYAAWRVLEEYYKKGTIRAIGVSNMEPDRLVDLIAFNEIKPALNQIETHLYSQRKTEHIWQNKYQVAHQAYAPLGQGRANEMFGEEVVIRIAARHGKTPAQVLLRFLLQNEVAVIPKTVHSERMKENIDVFDFVLSEEELAQLAELDAGKPMIGQAENPDKAEAAMNW